MFNWLRENLHHPSPLEQWTVRLVKGEIVIEDDQGTRRSFPIDDLRRVIVATDDSGPWGADVVFFLFGEDANPVGAFPLEAKGRDEFVVWMSRQPGYQDEELRKAMGSTSIARFEVFSAGLQGG
jgi:hypothetical protein